jgi:hypothetical protein
MIFLKTLCLAATHIAKPHKPTQQPQAWQRVCLPHRTTTTTDKPADEEEHRTDNSTYKKLAVQWLNEALSFVSSSVLRINICGENRQLLVAAKR